jgi:hypothetical protein
MYSKKNNGPNIEPCGTPHFIKRSDENEFFYLALLVSVCEIGF